MSRPYLNVTDVTYNDPVLSVTFELLRLRGGGTISVTGFSQSLTLSTTYSYAWPGASTKSGAGLTHAIVATFSVNSSNVVGTHNVGLSFPKLGGVDHLEYSFTYALPTTTTTTAAPTTTTTTTP